jgi:hypothetical protein
LLRRLRGAEAKDHISTKHGWVHPHHYWSTTSNKFLHWSRLTTTSTSPLLRLHRHRHQLRTPAWWLPMLVYWFTHLIPY